MITERRLPVTHCRAKNYAKIAATAGAARSIVAKRIATDSITPNNNLRRPNSSLRHSRRWTPSLPRKRESIFSCPLAAIKGVKTKLATVRRKQE